MKNYVLNAFLEKPWAIMPQKLAMLEAIVARHVAGEKLSAEQIQAAINGVSRPDERAIGKVAVLPLFGTIIPRAEFMSEMSGATSAESFGKKFNALVNDPEVSAIVLDVNSPGGQVGGIQELSDTIFSARGKKPIIAVANQLAASAAYWVATAADELVVTPSGEVGSIGVFAAHQDFSKALENEGVKISLISAGKYKVEGNPYEPLAEEARASIQENVNVFYDAFIAAIAKNRGVNPASVRDGFGEGRVVNAQQAVALGMADSVATLDEVIQRLTNGNAALVGDESQTISDQSASSGQASTHAESNEAPNWIAQARTRYLEIAIRSTRQFSGGTTVNVREKMKARADKLARATEITELADNEQRDFTQEERAEFDACMADSDALAKEITQANEDREKLRAALALDLNATAEQKAEKPDGQPAAESKVKTLAEFNELSPADRMAFVKAGGTIS